MENLTNNLTNLFVDILKNKEIKSLFETYYNLRSCEDFIDSIADFIWEHEGLYEEIGKANIKLIDLINNNFDVTYYGLELYDNEGFVNFDLIHKLYAMYKDAIENPFDERA